MSPRHGLCSSLTLGLWRHSIWNARGKTLRSDGKSSSETTRSPHPPVFRQFRALSLVTALPFTAMSPDWRKVTAHNTLRCHIYLALGWLRTHEWRRSPGVSGLTGLGRITATFHLQISGGMPLKVIIKAHRYVPRLLHSDDDNNLHIAYLFSYFIIIFRPTSTKLQAWKLS